MVVITMNMNLAKSRQTHKACSDLPAQLKLLIWALKGGNRLECFDFSPLDYKSHYAPSHFYNTSDWGVFSKSYDENGFKKQANEVPKD